MIAEGPFRAKLVEVDVAFEHDLRVGRNFEIHGLALHQFHRLLPQESGDDEFLDIRRRGNNRRKCQCRVRADRDGYFHPS